MSLTVILLLPCATLVLIALSALLAAGETALNAAPRAELQQRAGRGDARADIVRLLRRDKDRLVAALLLGKKLTAVLAMAVATTGLTLAFGLHGLAYAALLMVPLLVVFCEYLPRTIALQHPLSTALTLAVTIRVAVAVLSPLASALRWLTTLTLRRIARDASATAMFVSPIQTLRGAIEVHAQEAGEIHQERAMLHSIVELGDVEVSEIMVHRQDVLMVDIDAPITQILDQIVTNRYTRVPLWRDEPDNIIGILHTKALLQILRDRKGGLERADLLAVATPPWFVPDTRTLIGQLEAFRRRRKHFAVVVDEYGEFRGIVTLEDILEEIVGDIADEHDITAPGVGLAPDGTVIVEGTATIRDLNRRFDWSLPDEDAATVAGLILHESRQIPTEGTTFEFHDFRFEIMQRKRHQITLIRISPPQQRRALDLAS